jgi:hypothetical protein
MPTLAAFLLSITGSIATRVLTALGIGVFSYAALTTLATTVSNAVITNFNSMPTFAFNIVLLAGGGQAIGIILGAFIARASLMAIKTLRPI